MLKEYIKRFINSRTYVFRDNALTHLISGDKVTKTNKIALTLVGGEYIVEVNHFFKVKKYKELVEAAKYFAEQNKPYEDYQYWLIANKANQGYFATICFIDKSTLSILFQMTELGGIVIPERVLVTDFIQSNQILSLPNESYIADNNYRLRYTKQQNAFFNVAYSTYSQTNVTESQLYDKILQNFDWQSLLPHVSKFRLAERNKPKLSVGSIFGVSLIGVGYLCFSSVYLYFSNSSVMSDYAKNKELLTSVKSKRNELELLESKVESLNAPFKSYIAKHEAFAQLPKSSVGYELTSILINTNGVTIGGSALNATALFEALSQNQYITDVEHRRPVRRIGEQDLFSISFKLEK